MKHLQLTRMGTSVFFFLLTLFFISCNPDDPELTYPTSYKYDKLDFKPSRFYVLTDASYTEIAPAGYYASFDSIFKDNGLLEVEQAQFPFERVELLNETQANVTFFDFLNAPTPSLLVDYSFDQTTARFVVTGVTDTLSLSFAQDFSTAVFPLYTTQFTEREQNGAVNYSPFYTRSGSPEPALLISELRQKWNLSTGDTIAVNISGYLFVKE